jgi:hypothetical protein
MLRLSLLTLVLAGVALAQDKKPDDTPVKAKGTLPMHWKELGLSKDQVQSVYTTQAKYNAEIDKLKAQIEKLKTDEKADLMKILTDEQRTKLKAILSGDKPKDK